MTQLKTQIVTKLINANCDTTQKLKLWQNTKTQLWQNSKTIIVTKLPKFTFKSIFDKSHFVRTTWHTWQPMRCAQGSLLRFFGSNVCIQNRFWGRMASIGWTSPSFTFSLYTSCLEGEKEPSLERPWCMWCILYCTAHILCSILYCTAHILCSILYCTVHTV